MKQVPISSAPDAGGKVVDFDAALLDACPPEQLDEIMAEAAILAEAFAPDGRAPQLEALAHSLQSGVRDLEFGRAHARLLAAALHCLALAAAARALGRSPAVPTRGGPLVQQAAQPGRHR